MKKSTITAQKKLAQYVKDGNLIPIDGAKPERLSHYRRLVFNVIFDTLTSAFPIARMQLGSSWKDLIDRFFATNNCQNNQVWRMPKEFLLYVENHEKELLLQFPYLNDLLRFEWVEIELYSEENKTIESYKLKGNWLNNTLVLNPHHCILELEYPVFAKGYENMATKKGLYHLLILRDLNDLKVRFLELSPLFALALTNLNNHQNNLLNSLVESAKNFGDFPKDELALKGQNTVDMLQQRNLIIGFG